MSTILWQKIPISQRAACCRGENVPKTRGLKTPTPPRFALELYFGAKLAPFGV